MVHSDSHISVPAGVWAEQPTTGEKPPPLSSHTFTQVDHHRAVLFGGWTGRRINDTYILDMKTWVWKCMCLHMHTNLFCTHTIWLLGTKTHYYIQRGAGTEGGHALQKFYGYFNQLIWLSEFYVCSLNAWQM